VDMCMVDVMWMCGCMYGGCVDVCMVDVWMWMCGCVCVYRWMCVCMCVYIGGCCVHVSVGVGVCRYVCM